MSSRIDGSNRYPHTAADEEFNKLMGERDRLDFLPLAAGKAVVHAELASQTSHPVVEQSQTVDSEPVAVAS